MGDEHGRQELYYRISALLEFSAEDDVRAFKDAVEKEGHSVDEVGLWYGRRVGSKELSFEERTPLMIAAMFGSKTVLSYILETGHVDVNRICGSDGATALHCAVAGCSTASLEVIKLLLNALADVNIVDANGNRPSDLILSMISGVFDSFDSRKRKLQVMLGADDIDEVCLRFDEAVGIMEKQQQQIVGSIQVSKYGTEKKADYLVDLPLPDINNGIYSTDEFRMYTFKVVPCSRTYSHDWTLCPFVHPGENARRRDLRKHHYSCVLCPEFQKGSCSKGDGCEFAHGTFECWLHPAQYRTRLCKDKTRCGRIVCFFAHKSEELRPMYSSTGSAMPSPGLYSANSPLGSPSTLITPAPTSTLPLTPSRRSPLVREITQHTQSHGIVPNLQLPRNKMKSAVNARNLELDIELLRRENHLLMMQQSMMEGIPASFRDHMMELNRLAGVKPVYEDICRSQLQSPTGFQVHQNVNQQQLQTSTSSEIGSPSHRVDPFEAATTMSLNLRNSAFSNRTQSFVDPSMVNRDSEFPSFTTTNAVESPTLSNWVSPGSRLYRSVCRDKPDKLNNSF